MPTSNPIRIPIWPVPVLAGRQEEKRRRRGGGGGDTRPGKHTKNDGKSQFYSWVNQLFQWPFSIAMLVYWRVFGGITLHSPAILGY